MIKQLVIISTFIGLATSSYEALGADGPAPKTATINLKNKKSNRYADITTDQDCKWAVNRDNGDDFVLCSIVHADGSGFSEDKAELPSGQTMRAQFKTVDCKLYTFWIGYNTSGQISISNSYEGANRSLNAGSGYLLTENSSNQSVKTGFYVQASDLTLTIDAHQGQFRLWGTTPDQKSKNAPGYHLPFPQSTPAPDCSAPVSTPSNVPTKRTGSSKTKPTNQKAQGCGINYTRPCPNEPVKDFAEEFRG